MICADKTMFSEAEALQAARAIQKRQLLLLKSAVVQIVGQMPAIPERMILSGRGDFLARRLINRLAEDSAPKEVISLTEKLGAHVSRAATAHALAVLAREQVTANA
jgi:uncharacterized hydantoinase/oxoprolinase family protein